MISEKEKQSLQVLANDPALLPAFKKVMDDELDRMEAVTLIELKTAMQDVTNESVGARLRAFTEGRKLVENIFGEIAEYASNGPQPLKVNPAR